MSLLISAYAVTTTSTSCTSARIALEANLMSLNLNQIYNSMKIHEIITAFTALFIAKYLTRAFYGVCVRAEKFYGKAKKRKVIRFVQNRVKYFVISGVVILASIGGMIYFGATSGNALNYSLEFVGGTSTTADFGKEF